MLGKYKAPDKAGLRRFGWVTGAIFIGFFGLLAPLLKHKTQATWPRWPFVVGAPFLVLGTLWPMALKRVHKIWMTAGGVLGFVNTRIVLTFVFFVVVTPLALAMRLFGKDSLGKRFDKQKSTYRVDSAAAPKERMKEPF